MRVVRLKLRFWLVWRPMKLSIAKRFKLVTKAGAWHKSYKNVIESGSNNKSHRLVSDLLHMSSRCDLAVIDLATNSSFLSASLVEKLSADGLGLTDQVAPVMRFDCFCNMFAESQKLHADTTIASRFGGRKITDLTSKCGTVLRCVISPAVLPSEDHDMSAESERCEHNYLMLSFVETTDLQKKRNELAAQKENLQCKANMYLQMLNNAPFLMWYRDVNLGIQYMNEQYAKAMDGIQSGDGVEQNVLELFPQSNRLTNKIKSEVSDNSDDVVPLIVNNSRRMFHISEVQLRCGGSVGYGIDITNIEQVEKKYAGYASMYQNLMGSLPIAIAIYDSDKRITFYNNAFVCFWGLSESWLREKPTYGAILNFLHEKRQLPEQPNFRNFKAKQLELFVTLTEPYNEFLYLPDNRALRLMIVPTTYGGLLFLYEDITNKLTMERAYNGAVAMRKATMDNLHEGIVVFGTDGKVKLYNPAFRRLWQLDEEFLSAAPHISDVLDAVRNLLIVEEDWEKFKERRVAELLHYSNMQHVSDIRLNNNIFLERITVNLPDGSILMSYRDETSTKLLEQSLLRQKEIVEEALRFKNKFLANVSYDLRSPLTSIIGFAEMLYCNYFGQLNETQKKYMEDIFKATGDLSSIIDDILDLASIEAGSTIVHKELIDVSTFLFEMKERVQSSQGNCQQVGLSTVDGAHIMGDRCRLGNAIGKLALTVGKVFGKEFILNISSFYNEDNPVIELKFFGTINNFGRYMFSKNQYINNYDNDINIVVSRYILELHGGNLNMDCISGIEDTVVCRAEFEMQEATGA